MRLRSHVPIYHTFKSRTGSRTKSQIQSQNPKLSILKSRTEAESQSNDTYILQVHIPVYQMFKSQKESRTENIQFTNRGRVTESHDEYVPQVYVPVYHVFKSQKESRTEYTQVTNSCRVLESQCIRATGPHPCSSNIQFTKEVTI